MSSSATSGTEVGHRKRTARERLADLPVIADLYLQRRTQHEITDHINAHRPYKISRSQIAYDLVKIREDWLAASRNSMTIRKAEELARLDKMEREAWDAWEKSKSDRKDTEGERTTKPGTGEGLATTVVLNERQRMKAHTRDGNPRFFELIFKCVEMRLAILGVKATMQIEHTGPGGGPIRTVDLRLDTSKLSLETLRELESVIDANANGGPSPPPEIDV